MELGSEVYTMALALQLQKLVVGSQQQQLLPPELASSTSARRLSDSLSRTTGSVTEWNVTSYNYDSAPNPYESPMVRLQELYSSNYTISAMHSFYNSNSSSNNNHHLLSSNISTSLQTSYAAAAASAAADTNLPDNLDYLYYRHSPTMNIVFCIAYSIVFLVGLIGNSFVIAVVLRAPRMRTVTNFFIVNLAIADILVIVFCLPATLLSNIFVRKYPPAINHNICITFTPVSHVSSSKPLPPAHPAGIPIT